MKITFPNNQVLEGTPEKIRDQLIKVYAKAGANESQSLYEVLELIKKITPISVQEEYNGQVRNYMDPDLDGESGEEVVVDSAPHFSYPMGQV